MKRSDLGDPARDLLRVGARSELTHLNMRDRTEPQRRAGAADGGFRIFSGRGSRANGGIGPEKR